MLLVRNFLETSADAMLELYPVSSTSTASNG